MLKRLRDKTPTTRFETVRPASVQPPSSVSYTDIHCHCLAGLDDGPATIEKSLELCRGLLADGVGTAIATPHQLGRFEGLSTPPLIRGAVADLNDHLRAREMPLSIHPGAEVRIDERIGALLDADRIMTLGDGGRYLLLEMPPEVLIDPRMLWEALAARSIRPVVSHPERNDLLASRPRLIDTWRQQGVILQITAACLLGAFGPVTQRTAWYLAGSYAELVVATDAHDLDDRRPRLHEAYAAIARRLGAARARQVCVDNPRRLLAGEDILSEMELDSGAPRRWR